MEVHEALQVAFTKRIFITTAFQGLRGAEVIVTRADEHEDPAIGAFLGLLEADIRAGRHLQPLPEGLARAILANIGHTVNLDEDIEGEVAL